MKKYFVLLLAFIALITSCKNEAEIDWTADSLSITCGALESAGDGNLKLNIPTHYKSTVKLSIKSNAGWIVSVDNMTYEEEIWVSSSVSEGHGDAEIDLSIEDNVTKLNRACTVTIATTGNIPVKKVITVLQGNTEDMLSISLEKSDYQDQGVDIEENNDGSWSMILPTDFNEKINVYVGGDVSPVVSIDYPENMPENWLSSAISPESNIVELTVSQNESKENRKAVVTFASKAGNIEVKKIITISQLGDGKIKWEECEYFQGKSDDTENAEIILPSGTLEEFKLAAFEQIDASYIQLPEPGDNDWFTLQVKDDGIYMTVNKANETTNIENTKEIVVKYNLTDQEYKINVRQCIPGFGITLNKKLWKAEFEGNPTFEMNGTLNKLYDNTWSNAEQPNLYLEIKTITENPGCSIIIDLGENPHGYTHIGLLPRLEWVEQSPRTVKVEYSSDGSEWKPGYDGNAFLESDLYSNGTALTKQWDCKLIRWFEINSSKINDRFVKVTFVKSWYGSYGRILSFDEFFISDKSENQE